MYLDLIASIASAIAAASVTATYYRAIVKRYEICPVYHILTRAALEMRWKSVKRQSNLAIAFADIDELSLVNKLHGYDEANRRLSAALSVLRRKDLFAGRFFSGDEFVIVAPVNDIDKPVRRLVSALHENELSATIAIALYKGEDSLTDAASEASGIVKGLKSKGIRGITLSKIQSEDNYVS